MIVESCVTEVFSSYTEYRKGGNISRFRQGDLELGATYLYVSWGAPSLYLRTPDQGTHRGTEHTDHLILHAPGHGQINPHQQVRYRSRSNQSTSAGEI